jgi:phytoene desaturase
MRKVAGRTDRVVIVGAGLGGLACALHLAATGREVVVIERDAGPGGRAGRLSISGYEFDTGPTVLTAPDLLAEPFTAVGENLDDWISLSRLDPTYRAHYPDGSTLDVHAEPDLMVDEIARLCGPREADGYLRFVAFARAMWELERDDFIARNLDGPLSLLRPALLRLAWMGGFRRLGPKIGQFFNDPRTQRIFSFQALYAGVAPQHALALYAVISYLDSVAGVYFPQGGIHAVPQAMAGAADKHGVVFRYGTTVTRVETYAGRAEAVHTADGERIRADVVVLNPDLPAAHRLIPAERTPSRLSRMRYSPSCVVLHLGSGQRYSKIAHHNIHFGRRWLGTFDDVIRDGRLMRDPSLLVTNPTRSDPSLAPAGKQVYYALAPVPNLLAGGPSAATWNEGLGRRYGAEIIATLEARGYLDLGAGLEVSHVVTPADWEAMGHEAGTPFASAHTFQQTGPFRPHNMHPHLSNVVFVGSGTQPGVGVPMVLISGKLAAQRVTG